MIKGYLKYFVLKFLKEADMTGYDLMKHLEIAVGKKPSPGSMYPLLKDMEEQSLVKSKEKGKTKVYTITKSGKEVLVRFKKEKETMFVKMNKSMSALVQLSGSTEQEFIKKIADHAKKSDAFLKVGSKELLEFKKTMFDMVQNGKYDRHEKEIRAILKEATNKIKKLK